MWRIFHICAIAAIVGAAVYAYSIKYDTIWHAEQVAKARHKIQRERDDIGVLRAEWAYLTRPERLQALAEKSLDMVPLTLAQIGKLGDLPERPKTDAIGKKLDALGLEPTTPRERKTSGATPSGAR